MKIFLVQMVLRWTIQGHISPFVCLNDWNICEFNGSIDAKVEQLSFHHIYINYWFPVNLWSVMKQNNHYPQKELVFGGGSGTCFPNNDQVPVNSAPAINEDKVLSHIQ